MLSLWVKLGLIAFGAVLGAWARFGLEQIMHSSWAVWIINMSACLLMGLVIGWLSVCSWGVAHKEGFHLLVLTGFAGGFATFAHYILYVIEYYHAGQWGMSAFYMVSSVVVGLVLLLFGLWLGARL